MSKQAADKTAVLKVGAGKERITSPIGVPILGHLFPQRLSEGVHDDIWAKALVFEQGAEKAVLIALDLAWPMPESDYVKIRSAVEKVTGIKAEKVMVSSTHNHQGPVFGPHPVFALSVKKQQELIGPWVESLPMRVAEAVKQAVANMRDAEVSFGKTSITGLAYNRRKHIPEGVASLINVGGPNKFYFGNTPEMPRSIREQYEDWGMSPEEAEEVAPLGIPDGVIDPDLDVLHIKDREGKTIGVLANFACHPVSCSPPVPNLISAGFPGFMADLVEETTGGVCLFTYGAGADIRPYRSSGNGFEEAQRIGLVLASGVLQAIRAAEVVVDPALKVESEMVEVALKEYPSREESERMLKEKRGLLEEAKAQGKFRDAKRLYEEMAHLDFTLDFGRWVGHDNWIDQKGSVALEIQAISVGELVFVSLPNEVNVSVGLEIKNASWTKKLFLVTLANGCYMYLLKREEYAEGGYEAAACRLAPGSGEQLIAVASGLVERMKP